MSKLRVVLLERASDHSESLLLQIRMNGHEAHVCYSPDECLAAAQRLKPQAVVLNAGLPMDRVYDLGRRLLSIAEQSRPLVMRVSQPGDVIDSRRAAESGVEFHLVKPIYASSLQGVLETCDA